MSKIKTFARLGVLVVGSSVVACSSNPGTSSTAGGEPVGSAKQSEVLHRAVCPEAVVEGEGRCLSRVVIDEKGNTIVNAKPTGFGPSDLTSAYNVGAGGTGMTVAVIDAFDNPDVEANLGVYRTQYGLPACTTANGCFKKVNQNGAASPLPKGNTDWGTEIALDVEMVSAICPSCKIILVEADNQTLKDLGTGVDSAVALGANAISNSYGFPDKTTNSKFEKHYNHPGVFIAASSGDSGYGTLYPAESEYTTAVGGTTLKTASNARGWTETVWSDGGSGCSSFAAKPSWQKDTGCSLRMEADVSAVADPNTGVAIYDSYGGGGWIEVGGTSVASPVVASIFAVAGKTTATPEYSYSNPGNFNDVTSGTNGPCKGEPAYFCNAEVGYDGPTGNGTPNEGLIAK